jgi:hypothetical protein
MIKKERKETGRHFSKKDIQLANKQMRRAHPESLEKPNYNEIPLHIY